MNKLRESTEMTGMGKNKWVGSCILKDENIENLSYLQLSCTLSLPLLNCQSYTTKIVHICTTTMSLIQFNELTICLHGSCMVVLIDRHYLLKFWYSWNTDLLDLSILGTRAILVYQLSHKGIWFAWLVHSSLYQLASSHATEMLLWSDHV